MGIRRETSESGKNRAVPERLSCPEKSEGERWRGFGRARAVPERAEWGTKVRRAFVPCKKRPGAHKMTKNEGRGNGLKCPRRGRHRGLCPLLPSQLSLGHRVEVLRLSGGDSSPVQHPDQSSSFVSFTL